MPLEIGNLKRYEVPPGTRAKECNGENCTARIYWVRPPASKGPIPVRCDTAVTYKGEPYDLSSLGLRHPTAAEHGLGINHYQDCPDANRFSHRTTAPNTPRPGIAATTAVVPPVHAPPAAPPAPEIPAVIPPVIEPAIARQIEASLAAGVKCTSAPCENGGVVGVIVHAVLFAVPCHEHADEVLAGVVKTAKSCRVDPVTDYLENAEHPEYREIFVRKAVAIRMNNAANAAKLAAGDPPPVGGRAVR